MEQKVLLTPGPITTSNSVKQAMQIDLGTRDSEYQSIVQDVRTKLLALAQVEEQDYSCILLQGSGTYSVESVLTSVVAPNQKVLILINGAYGERMEQICIKAHIPYVKEAFDMCNELPLQAVEKAIASEDITHVAYIHCETTAGILNNLVGIQALITKYNKISIVDAMSSFASVPINVNALNIDYLITSSNKCLHGVPGIGIIFARKFELDKCCGNAHSLSLDLYDQYKTMEASAGSFRFTSPTHVILALNKAIDELNEEGGIAKRSARYVAIQQRIRTAMISKGFQTLIDPSIQSPVITTFLYPDNFDFPAFYDYFKEHGFLLYNGKLPGIDAFRIGNIGSINDSDVDRFITLLNNYKECA
ncbi:MAG: 2-aminoethylphosphonate--pyruvate transaminase [Longicatena sp.]